MPSGPTGRCWAAWAPTGSSAQPGVASLYDLALLGGMYGMLAGFFHSVALAGTEKVATAEFTSLLVPWLNAMVATLPGTPRDRRG